MIDVKITILGSVGTGKTTVANLMANHFRELGIEVDLQDCPDDDDRFLEKKTETLVRKATIVTFQTLRNAENLTTLQFTDEEMNILRCLCSSSLTFFDVVDHFNYDDVMSVVHKVDNT